jgi:hypothetical protein
MTQSRGASLAESVVNVAVGYALAVATQAVVFPMFGLDASPAQHIGIAAIFTAISLARSYSIRRLFNSWRRTNG